jgi:hypothetical protein
MAAAMGQAKEGFANSGGQAWADALSLSSSRCFDPKAASEPTAGPDPMLQMKHHFATNAKFANIRRLPNAATFQALIDGESKTQPPQQRQGEALARACGSSGTDGQHQVSLAADASSGQAALCPGHDNLKLLRTLR